MKNLINFFFSFDKLMKEKLIVPFFWLSIILIALYFSTVFLETIWLGPLAKILNVFTFFVAIVFSFVGVRLLCELMVAIFRINNNLSPDGGRSETADIDPMVEARKAAEAAALRAREVTKTAGEKASAATKSAVDKTKNAADSAKDSVGDMTNTAVNKTKSAAKSASSSVSKTKTLKSKTSDTKAPQSKKPTDQKRSAKKTAPAKSKPVTPKKPAPIKSKSSKPKSPRPKTSAKTKPGPKRGTKARRDAQGRVLNKDGSLRKKSGPKAK